jgi:D-arabinose 5-phosphate isomerase GutQ
MSDLVLRLHDIGREDPFGYIATSSSLVNAAMGDALCVLLLEARGYTLVAFGQTHPRVQWVVA